MITKREADEYVDSVVSGGPSGPSLLMEMELVLSFGRLLGESPKLIMRDQGRATQALGMAAWGMAVATRIVEQRSPNGPGKA